MNVSQSFVVPKELFDRAKTGLRCNVLFLGMHYFNIDETNSSLDFDYSVIIGPDNKTLKVLVSQIMYKRIFRINGKELEQSGYSYRCSSFPYYIPVMEKMQSATDELIDGNSIITIVEFYCFNCHDDFNDLGCYS